MKPIAEDWREDLLLRSGLILLAGTAVAGAFLSGRGGPGTVLAGIALLLAVGPVERLREELSFAGHRVPALAVFGLGLAVALTALAVAVL